MTKATKGKFNSKKYLRKSKNSMELQKLAFDISVIISI